MKTKNETLPEGTITNAGVVKADGTVEPFKRATEIMTEAEVLALKARADAAKDVPVTVVKVDSPTLDEGKISLIKAKVCPNCTNTEFELLMYMANKYNLDPLLKQIWAVKFGDSPAQIYAGRDGFLEIAHRSGHFDGMETIVHYDKDEKPMSATCIVWRSDMTHPFTANVLFREYNTGKNLWASKPAVMIGKVAESVCLRKAFSVSGVYCPEELPERM